MKKALIDLLFFCSYVLILLVGVWIGITVTCDFWNEVTMDAMKTNSCKELTTEFVIGKILHVFATWLQIITH